VPPGTGLKDAALAFCDPQVTAALSEAFKALCAAWGPSALLGGPFDARPNGMLGALAMLKDLPGWESARAAYAHALRAVESDLRMRIESGELVVRGIQARPTLERNFTDIVPNWAEDLEIDWIKNSVTFENYKFSNVKCSPAEFSRYDSEKVVKSAKKDRRRRFPWEELVTIAQGKEMLRPLKLEAIALREEFMRRFPNVDPPAERTIKDHVTEIYRLAGEKSRASNP
jgi:hypothetical protein